MRTFGLAMIRGIIETSFLDWDGRVVAVLYTGPCNFKCPFCHNWLLIEDPEKYPEKTWEEVRDFLTEYLDFLDGVCITGGEPTLEKGLADYIVKIRELGLKVKLDTNGTRPSVLKMLFDAELIDALAMDVKMPLDERYEKAAGVKPDLDKLRESIELIRNSGIEYEFRTTVVPTIHTKEDIIDTAKMLAGAEKYVLQQFNPDNAWNPDLRKVEPYSSEVVLDMANAAKKYVKEVALRGLK